MKKVFKWTGFVVGGLAAVAVAGFVCEFIAAEHELDRQFALADNAALVIPASAVEIAEGRRIAQLAGRRHCHSDNLAGTVVDDVPKLIRRVVPINAPALAVAKGYTLEQFTRLMQKGAGLGDRQFKLMTPTAKARFTQLRRA